MSSLERRVTELKKMVVEVSDRHCVFGPYTQKYRLLGHMVEDMLELGTISVLDSNLFEHASVQIKQVYKAFCKKRDKNNER